MAGAALYVLQLCASGERFLRPKIELAACKTLGMQAQRAERRNLFYTRNLREAIADQTSFDEPFRHMGRARAFPST